MAAITSAAVVAAGSAYAANRQGAAQKKAGRAQANAAQQTIDQQRQIYDQSVSQATPYLEAGTNALTGLNALAAGDYSAFQNAPDYQFALQQGLQGLDRSAASRGSLYSGGQQADTLKYAQGLASQNLGNYRNSLMGLAQMGQNQSQYLGQLGQGFGNQFGAAMGQKGQANALVAGAGAMTQAGYGNALAAGAGAYLGAGGGGGGGGGGWSPQSSWGAGVASSPGSNQGFGNNMQNFLAMGNGRTSSWGG